MIALAKPMLGIEEKILVNEVLSSGKLAHGEIAAERVVSIPVHPGLTEQEVDCIVSSLQKYE